MPYHSYTHRARQVSSQRLLNCFVEAVPEPSKAPITLLRSPGIADWITLPTSPVQAFIEHKEILHVVAGNTLYSVAADGTYVSLGLIAGSGPIRMATNGVELVIVSNPNGYIYTTSLVQITNAEFNNFGAKDVAYIDGFMVYLGLREATFFNSEYFLDTTGLYVDAGTISSLAFDVATGMPDNLVALVVDHRQLFLFGKKSIEIWYNAGTIPFPFLREQNGLIEAGCTAPLSAIKADNTIFWLDDKRVARRLVDLTPRRISTEAIEQRWQDYTTIDDAYSVVYLHEGHLFWALTFPTENATWEYDIATNEWHERGSRRLGVENAWRVLSQIWCYGENIVGDSLSGKLGKIDANTYTEWGDMLRMEWTYPSVYADGRRAFHKRLQIEFEMGVGLTSGQGSDPQVLLYVSDDGGVSFTSLASRSMGRIGEYRYRSLWNRLGSSTDRVYKAAVSDPVRVAVIGSQLEVEGGRL